MFFNVFVLLMFCGAVVFVAADFLMVVVSLDNIFKNHMMKYPDSTDKVFDFFSRQ